MPTENPEAGPTVVDGVADLDSALRFAIDDAAPVSASAAAGLTIEKFYTDGVYAPRPSIEKEIQDGLMAQREPVVVIAPAGTGKTSTTYKALLDLRDAHETDFAYVDLKAEQFGSEIIHRSQDGRVAIEEAQEWLQERLSVGLREVLNRSALPYELRWCLLFLDQGTRIAEHDKVVNRARGQVELLAAIDRRYIASDADETLFRWAIDRLKARDRRVLNVLKELQDHPISLTAQAYLTAASISHRLDKCVPVFLDNVDSVMSNDVREMIYTVLRGVQPTLSPYVHVLTAARPENVPFAPFAADRDSYQVTEVRIDCSDAVVWPTPDEKEQLEVDAASTQSGSGISKEITRRRIEYVKKHGATTPEDRSIIHWMEQLNQHEHASSISRWFGNSNQRFVARQEYRFAQRLAVIAPNGFDTMSLNGQARNIATLSLYYRWLGKNMSGRGPGHYDFNQTIARWNGDPENTLGCLVPHLVLAALRNRTGQSAGRYEFSRGCTFDELLETMSPLQLDDSEIAATTFQLAVSGGLGRLIDLELEGEDHYRWARPGVSEVENAETTVRARLEMLRRCGSIRINQRGCVILEHLSTRFFYFVGAGLDVGAEPESVDSVSELITVGSDLLTQTFSKLQQLCVMTLHGLVDIRERFHSDGWLDEYRSRFCIKVGSLGQFPDERGNLLVDNMLDVFIGFLKHKRVRPTSWPHGDAFDTATQQQFADLRRKFRKKVDEVREGASKADLVLPSEGLR